MVGALGMSSRCSVQLGDFLVVARQPHESSRTIPEVVALQSGSTSGDSIRAARGHLQFFAAEPHLVAMAGACFGRSTFR